MRGRTNITQRALPYVNGDVITAEVETGNAISVGDFVEYKKETAVSIAEFDWGYDKNYLTQMPYGSNYILALRSNALEIWDKRNSQFVYLLPFNETVTNFTILSGNDIVVCSRISTSGGIGHIYYISFVNNELVINDTKEINKTTDISSDFANVTVNMQDVVEIDSTHIGIFTPGYRSDSYVSVNKAFITVVEINQTNNTFGAVVKSQELDLTAPGETYSNIGGIFGATKIVGQNKIIFGFSATRSTKYTCGCYITFDNTYTFTIRNKIVLGYRSSSSGAYTGFTASVKLNNTTFAQIYRENSSSSSGVTTAIAACRYSENDDDIFQLYNDTISTWSNTYVSYGSENNVIYIACIPGAQSYYQRIFRIEILANNTFKIANINVNMNTLGANYNQISSIFVYGSNDRIVSYTLVSGENSNKMVVLQYNSSDNELDVGIDTNYVKSYNDGKAIGFAKTAGVAGENIRIYVPHQS